MNIYEEQRPWGAFRRFTHGEETTVKLITVKAGEAFSLQYHAKRDEFWSIIEGNPMVTCGDITTSAKPHDEFFIPAGTKNRMQGGETDALFLEISFGHFDEQDIVRLEDKYNRT